MLEISENIIHNNIFHIIQILFYSNIICLIVQHIVVPEMKKFIIFYFLTTGPSDDASCTTDTPVSDVSEKDGDDESADQPIRKEIEDSDDSDDSTDSSSEDSSSEAESDISKGDAGK